MDRRRFLHIAAAGLLAAGCSRTAGQGTVQAGQSTSESQGGPQQTAAAAESEAEVGQQASEASARVVIVRSEKWLSKPDAGDLRLGLAQGIQKLTGASNSADGWREFFDPRENVAIKVNCLAGPALCSSPQLVAALIDELSRAGHPRGRLWVYDRTSSELEECGFAISRSHNDVKCMGSDEIGYQQDVTVTGSVGTQFSTIITAWADAIVNVPVAKDHDLAGISGALKNHLGSINNPNKLHFPDISLAIADLAAAPVLKQKQRLVVYDLLRVCYDGGPAFKPQTTKPYGAIILSKDPVAADAVVTKIIDDLRSAAGLPSLWEREAKPEHVKIAADEDHRLGCADLDKIELVEVEV